MPCWWHLYMYITTVCTTKSVIFGFSCSQFFCSTCSQFICLSAACIAEKAAREAKFDSFGGPDSMFILAVLYCMCSIRGSEIKITNRFYMYLCSNFKATQQTNFCGYTFGIWITQKFLHHRKVVHIGTYQKYNGFVWWYQRIFCDNE